jgi:hypothetical protein
MRNKDLKPILHYFSFTLKDFSQHTGIDYTALSRLGNSPTQLLKYDYERALFEFIKFYKNLNYDAIKTIISNFFKEMENEMEN